MATSSQRFQISFLDLNLFPRVCSAIEFPKVIKLVVIIVLAAKDVEFIVVAGAGHGGTLLGASVVGGVLQDALWGDGLAVGHGELGEVIGARTVDEASENHERTITEVAHHVVVSRGNHLVGLSIAIDSEPGVCVGVEQVNLVIVVLALEATVEDYFLGWAHLSGVMRDTARSTA